MSENLLDSIPAGGRIVHGAKLFDLMKRPPPPFLFEGFIRQRSITALVADPHSYKSFIMMAMAIALDYNLPLFGRFAPTQTKRCFFVGADAPDWDYGQLAHKLFAGYGIEPRRRELCGVEGVFDEAINILDPAYIEWFAAYHKFGGGDVLFLDSKRSTTNTDENNSQDAVRVNKVLKFWRSSGITVIYAHHTAIGSHDEGRSAIYAGRGSGEAVAACDFQFNLRNVDAVAVGNTRVRIIPAKGRGLASPPDLEFVEANYTPCGEKNAAGEGVAAVHFTAPSRAGKDAIVMALLASKPGGVDRAELVAAVRANDKAFSEEGAYRAVDNILQSLRKQGKASAIGRGRWTTTTKEPACPSPSS